MRCQGIWNVCLFTSWDMRCHEYEPQPSNIAFVETDQLSIVILSLPLIHKGQLSVTGESMCLGGLSLPRNSVSSAGAWRVVLPEKLWSMCNKPRFELKNN